MIEPRRSPAFTALFTWHARRRAGRAFEELRVRGLEELRSRLAAGPALVVSNHTAWWDPLLALILARELRAEAYAMMDARNLRALPFFGRVGAFGVDLDDPRDGARAIRFAARLLDRPRRLVWIFAQGEERPITVRPLGFRPGSAEIARLAAAASVTPVALRYEFGSTERPVAFVSAGEAVVAAGTRKAREGAIERAVEAELGGIDDALARRDPGAFSPVLHGTRRPLAATAQRLLAFSTAPGEKRS